MFIYKNVFLRFRSDGEILLDDKNVYDIESDTENGNIKYNFVSKDEIKSSNNKKFQCTIIYDNVSKFNNIRTTNLLPFCNSVFKSRNLIIYQLIV